MQKMKKTCLLYAIFCVIVVSCCEAVEISQKEVTASDGTAFEVTEITDDDTDIVILKKDGQIYEQQITQMDKEYIITKVNNTCNVEFLEEEKTDANNTCYTGRTPSEDEITPDMKAECGNLEVRFVNSVNCSKENHVDKRFVTICITRCYFRYKCVIVWFLRTKCTLQKICYRQCFYGK